MTSLVLVTGATGHIGRHLVAQLLSRGYTVRAITSKPLSDQLGMPGVEWHSLDFHASPQFDGVLEGCCAVFHLGAELALVDRMWQANVVATQSLAQASERTGVKVFCYTSSVAVYGSGRQRLITEDSPVLTSERDVPSEYFANDTLRCYGRTKLAGEQVLRAAAPGMECVVVRPTVVVDVADLLAIGNWSLLRKSLAAHRHAHHIYVRDVADAMIWLVERGIRRSVRQPGVTTFNLAEDELQSPTYAHFLRLAYDVTKNRKYRVVNLPPLVDRLRVIMQFRRLPLRYTFGSMRFSNRKLRDAGYTYPFGMAQAIAHALSDLGKEEESYEADMACR